MYVVGPYYANISRCTVHRMSNLIHLAASAVRLHLLTGSSYPVIIKNHRNLLSVTRNTNDFNLTEVTVVPSGTTWCNLLNKLASAVYLKRSIRPVLTNKFCSQTTETSHPCSRKYRVSVRQVSEIKNIYLRKLISYIYEYITVAYVTMHFMIWP